jgi:GNAT superfamily N-acetyltransferase
VIRADVEIRLDEVEPTAARIAIDAHQLSLDWSGDDFLAQHWLDGTQRAVVVDGRPVGLAVWNDEALSLLTLEPAAVRYDRQVLEVVLAESGARTAYVGSWDSHHVATFGAFASGVGSQAYQFRLLAPDDLRAPVDDLEIRAPEADDLAWLVSTGFLDGPEAYVERNEVSVVMLDGGEAGIAVHVPHPLEPDVVSIGMYVDPLLRRRGVGSSILSLTARAVLDSGRTPVAGCWWRNWSSRATLEAAGLVCAGTILRFDLDPETFVRAAAD